MDFSWLSSIGSGIGNVAKAVSPYIAPVTNLASTGLGIYSNIQAQRQGAEALKMQNRALADQRAIAQQQQAVAAPAAQAGADLTAAGASAMTGGALPPGLQAQVDDWKRRTRGQLQAHMAGAGLSDSSMAAQWDAYIDQQAGLYAQQLAAGLLGSGYQGIGTATGAYGGAAGTNQNVAAGYGAQAQGAQQVISSSQQALAQLLGTLGRRA